MRGWKLIFTVVVVVVVGHVVVEVRVVIGGANLAEKRLHIQYDNFSPTVDSTALPINTI